MIHTDRRKFKTLEDGTKVWWHYRSAIGHGKIESVNTLGSTKLNTKYNVDETDHHKDEPPVVIHTGAALHRA